MAQRDKRNEVSAAPRRRASDHYPLQGFRRPRVPLRLLALRAGRHAPHLRRLRARDGPARPAPTRGVRQGPQAREARGGGPRRDRALLGHQARPRARRERDRGEGIQTSVLADGVDLGADAPIGEERRNSPAPAATAAGVVSQLMIDVTVSIVHASKPELTLYCFAFLRADLLSLFTYVGL